MPGNKSETKYLQMVDLKRRSEGRPSNISDTIRKVILKYIETGNYISTACQAAGIPQRTYHNWGTYAKDVEDYIDEHDIYIEDPACLTDDDIKYLREVLPDNLKTKIAHWQFFHRLKTAEAKAEAGHVANLAAAGKKPQYWAASATYLERKAPERWGRRDAVDIQVKEGTQLLEKLSKILQGSPQAPALPAPRNTAVLRPN